MKPIHFRYAYLILILFAGSGLLYLLLQPLPEDHQQQTLCLFHRISGLPCPACGTGRGIICILHGEFTKAWMFNPLCFVVLILSIIVFGRMMIDLVKNQFTLLRAMKKPISFKYMVVPLILVLINWYWTITKGL